MVKRNILLLIVCLSAFIFILGCEETKEADKKGTQQLEEKAGQQPKESTRYCGDLTGYSCFISGETEGKSCNDAICPEGFKCCNAGPGAVATTR